jgi:transposase
VFDGKIPVRYLEQQKGFVPLRRRWVVERTFGWMMPWGRLVRDYEKRLDVSENMIYVAMSSLLLNRIFSEKLIFKRALRKIKQFAL